MPTIVRGDARSLPLADASVDLVVTSPPYFGLRSYRDGGVHYAGQIGAESTVTEYVDALVECTREWMRVLKPSGSIWVNLGDSYYSGKGAPGRATIDPKNAGRTARRTGSSPLDAAGLGYPRKTLLGIPGRYAIRCMDDLGLIWRAEVVWSKPNGLPESVTDRVRRSHEQWFHFTVQPRYYSAVDEIREPASGYVRAITADRGARNGSKARAMTDTCNPLGKLPGSVWEIATQPLVVPDHISHARCCNGHKRDGCTDGIDHFAAFPMELPRRIITGWSPREVCTGCGEGRRPVVETPRAVGNVKPKSRSGAIDARGGVGASSQLGMSGSALAKWRAQNPAVHLGYACACSDTSAPSVPAVVLDPFGGTGTTALVAAALGRTGITVDASADYCRLAQWRCGDPKQQAKAAGRVAPRPPRPVMVGQVDLFEGVL